MTQAAPKDAPKIHCILSPCKCQHGPLLEPFQFYSACQILHTKINWGTSSIEKKTHIFLIVKIMDMKIYSIYNILSLS